MLVTRRAPAVALALAAVCALTACSGDGDDRAAALIDVTTMRGAFLQAAEIGETWRPPTVKPDEGRMVSLCGGPGPLPETPPGADVVMSSFADEGTAGAQSLTQTALVYPDADAAAAGQALLRAAADQCPPSISAPATVTQDRSEPAYTETVETRPLSQGPWSGFVVIRHKTYEPKHPGTADTAVAVLANRNVVLVDAYAIYRLKATSPAPGFETDWQRLVATVVQRVK